MTKMVGGIDVTGNGALLSCNSVCMLWIIELRLLHSSLYDARDACFRAQLMTRMQFVWPAWALRTMQFQVQSNGSVGGAVLGLRVLIQKHKYGWVHNFHMMYNWCGRSWTAFNKTKVVVGVGDLNTTESYRLAMPSFTVLTMGPRIRMT